MRKIASVIRGKAASGGAVARYGPFVMNTSEEIHRAMHDYAAGKL
jgi:redox-sensitive bicupin YhaK (pirin superfamily)